MLEIDTVDELIRRARDLAGTGQRRILGITGPPAAGKGLVAGLIGEALGDTAVIVPMDGFHLAEAELRRLGKRDRKGAPDTFDAAGYVALLRRLRQPGSETIYAPRFHREVEESYAGAIPVAREVPLVITEGNYLLLEHGSWASVSSLLDESWFLAPDPSARMDRLIARHIQYGKSPSEAREWVLRSDERNAELVMDTQSRADVVVTGDPTA